LLSKHGLKEGGTRVKQRKEKETEGGGLGKITRHTGETKNCPVSLCTCLEIAESCQRNNIHKCGEGVKSTTRSFFLGGLRARFGKIKVVQKKEKRTSKILSKKQPAISSLFMKGDQSYTVGKVQKIKKRWKKSGSLSFFVFRRSRELTTGGGRNRRNGLYKTEPEGRPASYSERKIHPTRGTNYGPRAP